MTEIINLPHALVTKDGPGIATLKIVSHNHLNILGTPVIEQVKDVLLQLSTQQDIRILILRGQGDQSFVAGADIREMSQLNPSTAKRFIASLRDLCETVRQFPTPVIARIPGWCLGAGLELAMSCDIRLASTNAKFGMPEVKVGIPSVIHAALMPAMLGSTRASWMLLSGEHIDAHQALDWGLVTEVVETDELDGRLHEMARMFASLPPAALAQQKRLLHRWEQLALTDAINDSVIEFGRAFETNEPQHYLGGWVKQRGS